MQKTFRSLNLAQIGQDTEFFLWDKKKQEVIPSFKYFEPKGKEPSYYPYGTYRGTTEGGVVNASHLLRPSFKKNSCTNMNGGLPVTVYRDGLAVEFNSGAVFCRAWLWQDIKLGAATAISVKWPKRLPPNLTFTSRPWVAITPEMIETFPDDLKVLGCSPTLDAYTESQKVITVDPLKTFFRTSGAHLHASLSPEPPEEAWAPIMKVADLILGVPFTHIFGDELEFKRRKLYGQAGEFRHQNYPGYWKGLEYRVLSSRMYNHPAIFSLFSGLWKYTVISKFHQIWEKWDPAWEDDIKEAINLGTPGLFPKLLPIATSLINDVTSSYDFKLGGKGSYGKDGVWKEPAKASVELWDKLKALNLRGWFPDAGVINRMSFPEAHQGWGEYYAKWNL